ncbi:MAG: carboxylesterase family protein [Gammaproteobacteria bacterium]|nr:carboxylesterase family protein [Gammaproteobacteria bacterium]
MDPERLSLDLYLRGADHPRPARAPMVLYLHGGGWMAGSKAQSFLQPLVFVPEGFVFASANYRLRPEATVAEMAQSAAYAVGWLARHAGEFGGDPHRIFLVGHSAGAHLVSLLGTNAAFLENAGVPPASVRGVISLDTAVYDLPGLLAGTAGQIHRTVFGADRELQEEVSPWHHVRYEELRRAFLIFYSDGRPEGLTQAIPFGQRLRDAGHLATVVEAVGHDHGQVNNLLGTEGDVPTAQTVDFVKRHAGASDYREAALETELVPSPVEYGVLLPGEDVMEESAKVDGKLPVLLFLHGGAGNRGQLARWRGMFEAGWRSGALPPMVVAMPSATPRSYYVDYHDGSERWTTFLAGEFPRAVAARHGGDPDRVSIAGYSMGGVGALRVSFLHPEAFVAAAGMAAGIDPALDFDALPAWYEPWKEPRLGVLALAPGEGPEGGGAKHGGRRAGGPRAVRGGGGDGCGARGDPAFWAANNPASIAASDPDRLRDSGLAILVECGAEDQLHNHVGNEFLHRVLSDHGILHEYRLVLGEGHVPIAPERLQVAFEFLGRAVRGQGEAKAAARARFDVMVEPMRALGPPGQEP